MNCIDLLILIRLIFAGSKAGGIEAGYPPPPPGAPLSPSPSTSPPPPTCPLPLPPD